MCTCARPLASMLLLAVLGAATGWRGSPAAADEPPPTLADPARAEDVRSIDAIVAALYDVVSGPRSRPRDWDRFQSLFAPEARLIPLLVSPGRPPAARVLTVEQYIGITREAFERDGFYVNEVARRVERYGHLAHVFSTFEVRRAKDEDPMLRGINSIQLFFDGRRWSVLTLSWEAERDANPLPERYLTTPADQPDQGAEADPAADKSTI